MDWLKSKYLWVAWMMFLTLLVLGEGCKRSENTVTIKMAETNIPLIDKALQEFLLDNGRVPTQEEGLVALLVGPNGLEETWDGPYIYAEKLIDPWGHSFVYRIPSLREGKEYDVICYGRDGKLGGEGEDEDIYN